MNKKMFLIPAFLLTCLAGCNNSNSSSESIKFAFEKESISLITGNSYVPKLIGIEDDTPILFTSSNDGVATVDQSSGIISAGYNGKATITANYGDKKASMDVNVSFGENIPTIKIDNCDSSEITIQVGDTFTLDSSVLCNFKSFPYIPEYKLDANDVISITGNEILGVAKGNDTLYVSGKFGDYELMPISLKVNVIDNVQINMFDGTNELGVANIMTASSFMGKEYQTSFTPTFKVTVNGEQVNNYTVELINNDGVVSYDATSKKITALKAGTCAYKVSYGDNISKTFPIVVNKPTGYYGDTIFEIDETLGELPSSTIFASLEDQTIVSASSISGEEFTVNNGKITNISYNNNEVYQITVFNESVGYIINVKVYSKIIKTAQDLDFFHTGRFGQNLAEASKVNFPGTYILANNIDASSYVHASHCRFIGESCGSRPFGGLTGTFDGRGYTIDGITLGDGGLFGLVGQGGVVKNLGMTNVKFNNVDNQYTDEWAIASYIHNATLENIYIEIPDANRPDGQKHNTNVAAIAHDISVGSNISNLVIKMDVLNDQVTGYGSFISCAASFTRSSYSSQFLKDSYVISPYMLSRFVKPASNEVWRCDASNIEAEHNFPNVKRYNTWSEFVNAKNDFSSFDSDIWEYNSNGEIYFKSAK